MLVKNKQWNPNSSCNFNGDTALHLAVRYHRPVLARFLLSELRCEANAKNLWDETPIQLIIQLWSDLKFTELIKQIINTKIWDPNSICNPKGDTALHLSIRYYRSELVNFLVFKAGCLLNVKNHGGKTPLCLLMSGLRWRDSDCINLIRHLIVHECWNPNSACNSEGDTILHLAVLYHRPKVAEFLLLETSCDPNVKNGKGKIPLEVMIPMWPSLECISIIKSLISKKEWDPNSSCNSQNDTVLHLAARHHEYRVVDFLLYEAKCDFNIENRYGETFLKLLVSGYAKYDTECANTIKKLYYNVKQWNTNSMYYNGDTILHLSARYNKPNVTYFLVLEAMCDPSIRNKRGETPIHLMVSILSDTECFMIIKDIVVLKQWDPNSSCNSKGDTALYLSIQYHKPRVAQFLISVSNCDHPNIINKLLMVALWSDSECIDIIKTLIATKQWDPNSSCNSNDAIHLSIRYKRP